MNAPLFVADLATLKERLRLSGVPASATDTLAILDDAVLRARLDFYRRLGETRVTTLLAITYTENPTTNEAILRALANSVEVNLVYRQLLVRLPQQWMDSSGDAYRRWNEEAPFREKGPSMLDKEVLRLDVQIEEDFQILAGEETIGNETEGHSYDGTPDFCPPRPGDTLRGHTRRTSRFSED